MLNFPGSKFKGFLFQKFVYPQVELFCSKLGSYMEDFSQVRWCPKRRIFFAFPRPQNLGSYFIMFTVYTFTMYMMYIILLKSIWTVGASMAFLSHDSLKED